MTPSQPFPWSAIDTVLLDMDGTLLDLYFDNHFWQEHLPRRFAEHHGREAEAARLELEQLFAEQRGTLNWYCLDYWSQRLEIDISELKREVQHLIAIRPWVETFLGWLHTSERQVWLVTNAHRKSLEIKLECTGIDRWCDQVISSHDFQAPKESPVFWEQLQAAYPFDPARALLIDDTPSVLAAAQRYGIGHLLTLLQPDSRQAQRERCEFPGIMHFDEIMPVAARLAPRPDGAAAS
ncbi:MAG: GMP/IMP nucleotidase [Spongiibacteraceae bacterium]|jgi:putative hydrolase of the HAD superfamily|nr:GMP/IMP nucleotidase [Spongiibacteraceae bacterium]